MTTQKGTHITAFDSNPFTSVNSRLHGGVVKSIIDTFELTDTANADDAILARFPIDARLISLKFAFDDLGDAGTVDIGLHKKNSDGTYTAVDDNAFADAIDVNSAAVGLTEYRFSAKGIQTATQAMWELAGLSARPAYADLYLSITTDAGTTADGTVTFQAQYTE